MTAIVERNLERLTQFVSFARTSRFGGYAVPFREELLGVVLGLAGSLALARYIESQLFGVPAHDVQVLVGVTVLLLIVAAAACYIPARRATRVDPMVALREG